MYVHPFLERLLIRDHIADAFRAMTPEELVAIVLRLEGLPDGTIALLLGTSRDAINHRFVSARKRAIENVPELRVFLSDPIERRPRLVSKYGLAPLEHGWLCENFLCPDNPPTE